MGAIENMAAQQREDIRSWLVSECANRLAEAFGAMMAGPCEAAWLPEAGAEPRPDAWWRQPLNLGTGAEIWVGASDSSWNAIGSQALKAAGIDDAGAADVKNTYHEIVIQALSAAAQSLTARLGREVVCQPGEEASQAPLAEPPLTVEVRPATGDAVRISLLFGDSLLREIVAAEQDNGMAHVLREAGGAPAPVAADGSKTLDLLLDVELPVSVSFGRAQLPLKDVLKLTSGSIVELNRSVAEPVEVIVNNCVIARGEVVVIEGNYGVRIQQIVSRQERLRSLN